MPDEITGVNVPADAGQGAEVSEPEANLDNQTGEDTAPDAGGQVEETTAGQEPNRETQRTEQAFARRLAAEKAKMEAQIRAELEAQYRQPGNPQDEREQFAQQVQAIAEQFEVTPHAAAAMLRQQIALNNLQSQIAGQSDLAKAQKEVAALRAKNAHLPEFDEAAVNAIRLEYQRQGVNLPYRAAYDLHVAREAAEGRLTRSVEQKTIAGITARDKVTVAAGKGANAKPLSWDEMSADEFAQYTERALRGEFKKS